MMRILNRVLRWQYLYKVCSSTTRRK